MNKPPAELSGDLLAASIHEIKNRFGLLVGQLDSLMAELPVQPAQQQQVDQIKAETEFVGCELQRVLIQYKSLSLDAVTLDSQQFVDELLEEKIARHGATARAKNIRLEMGEETDAQGFFDPALVNVALDTAIYNAVNAGARQIRLTAIDAEEHPEQFLQIWVEDDGPGFPAEMMDQPIELQGTKQGANNTGMGLYLAQQLISRHQEGQRWGRIELAASTALGGAKVKLLLPQ